MTYEDQGRFRRKFPRRAFQRKVSVLYRGMYFLAQTGEIGEGGMSVFLPEPIAEGEEVVLNFRIPGAEFISLRAEVRAARMEPSGEVMHGLAFLNIQFTHKRQIRSYVSSRSAGESVIV